MTPPNGPVGLVEEPVSAPLQPPQRLARDNSAGFSRDDSDAEREGPQITGAGNGHKRRQIGRAILRAARRYPFRYLKMACSRAEVARYVRTHSVRLLNIGAQTNRPRGWLNIDLFPTFGAVYLDASNMSALQTASFDAVLCEHMIEHVPKPVGERICRECYRILKPGGVLRIVTPDIERMCRLVLAPGAEDHRYLELIRSYLRRSDLSNHAAVNLMFRDYGHQYIYARSELTLVLRQVGLQKITATSASSYRQAIFKDAQGHARLLGEEMNNLEAFALEAER
jgi:predicted SAM-dependent methyltransferase